MAVALRYLRRYRPRPMAELLAAFGCAVPVASMAGGPGVHLLDQIPFGHQG